MEQAVVTPQDISGLTDELANELRTNYGAYYLAMNPTYEYTYFQQELIAPVLERITIGDPQFLRTIVPMPFRHSKTEECIENFYPFWFGNHPGEHALLLTYNEKLARKSGRRIRDQMRTPLYEALFPESALNPASKATTEFGTVSGSMFYAAGFKGTINGLGFGLLGIDDAHKNREEAMSTVVMESIRDIYTSVIRTRLEPNAAIMIIGTRWTPGDLAGWRIDCDGAWDYLMNRPYEDVPKEAANAPG